MLILGLTGSIGMGKSTAARMLRRLGVPVHDADAVVHRLMGRGGAAVPAVAARFPEAVRAGVVDRTVLGAHAYADPGVIAWLERLLHPLVRTASRRFLAQAARRRARIVVLDIPLLYETGAEARCDRVAVVSAPGFIERLRVLARPGMSAARLRHILDRQVPDAEKRRRADHVVPSGLGRAVTFRALRRLVRSAKQAGGRHWPGNPHRERMALARSRTRHRNHRA